MTVSTLEDLLVHDLKDMYYAESELLDALEELAEQTETEDVSEAFLDHREQTEEHVDRLEEVFGKLDKDPEKVECEGINGLLKEHEEFVDEDPDQEVLDVHNIVAAQKTEHYEIAAYENMVLLAEELGMDDVAGMIESNLQEEIGTLDDLTSLAKNFD